MAKNEGAQILEFPGGRKRPEGAEAPLSGIESREGELQELKRNFVDLHLQNERIEELLSILRDQREQTAEPSAERTEITRRIAELQALFDDNNRIRNILLKEIRTLAPQIFKSGS